MCNGKVREVSARWEGFEPGLKMGRHFPETCRKPSSRADAGLEVTWRPSPHSYAFGSVGKEKFQIPPHAELRYEVHLKSFEKVSLPKTV